MARTKHIARRSFGGKAPRKALMPMAKSAAPRFGGSGMFNSTIQPLPASFGGSNNLFGAQPKPVKKDLSLLTILSKRIENNKKSDLDKEDVYGYTPFVLAIKKGWFNLATELLDTGFVDTKRVDNHTKLSPLHHAAQCGDKEFIEVLMNSFKSFIKAKDMCGNTPMHYAAFYRNKKYMDTLIKRGADVNATNKNLETPLMLLFRTAGENNEIQCDSKFDPIACVMLLINSGISIDLKNKSGMTALHLACIRGSTI